MKNSLKLTVIFILLLAAVPAYSCPLGTVSGRTVRPLFGFRASVGVNVPGAIVSLENLTTHSVRYERSNSFGYFLFTNVPCGAYEVSATSRLTQFDPTDLVISGQIFYVFVSTRVESVGGRR